MSLCTHIHREMFRKTSLGSLYLFSNGLYHLSCDEFQSCGPEMWIKKIEPID